MPVSSNRQIDRGMQHKLSGLALRMEAMNSVETAPESVDILPHGGTEITLWIALSVTAGICEETVFRGYLQWHGPD